MNNFWLLTVNMGYGHQRTAFPLKELAVGGLAINVNDYEGIPESDKRIWETTRRGYELISRFKRIPLLGECTFSFFDKFQRILDFYPKRNLSKPSLQLKQTFSLIKRGWGKDIVEKLKAKNLKLGKNLPFVSTFFTPAFMAEYFGYPGNIYCVVCDADISRAWAPFCPQKSRIKYFAPTSRVAERLKLYGVKEENILFTGYPLPKENIGGRRMDLLKEDLKYRLLNLDPQEKYREYYAPLIKYYLGDLPKKPNHPLTITFAVGGAGAQKETGVNILKNLCSDIKKRKIRVFLVAGNKEKIKNYFESNLKKLGLARSKYVQVLFGKNIEEYFLKFDLALRETDILWTKPSELSFYSALGLPLIIAPCIGSQEEFNKRWLLKSGFGSLQEDPKHLDQWLFDWLKRGYLAEDAMQGFVEGEKLGTFNIEEILKK
ncbi:MAG: hypothetical protein PHW72_03445 [Candidatus Pacebacteria bacterium]|nr:hypothetical protein [Candidatus Paceibacterota bacterium]